MVEGKIREHAKTAQEPLTLMYDALVKNTLAEYDALLEELEEEFGRMKV